MKKNFKYSDVYDFENLYKAAKFVLKTDKYSNAKLKLAYHLEEVLIAIQNELIWKIYKPLPSNAFMVRDPKPREIQAPNIKDRIVQVALLLVIEPEIDKVFDFDSYGCRKGKGTLAAANRLSYFLGIPSNRNFLYCDVRKCFRSVDVETMIEIFSLYYIDDEDILWLIRIIIEHEAIDGKGLKIGNPFSQLAINVYLNEIDRFLTHDLKLPHERLIDDFVCFSSSIGKLVAAQPRIEKKLNDDLHFELNEKTFIGKSKNGLTFCGYVVKPHSKIIRQVALDRARRSVKNWKSGFVSDEKFYASMASRVGHCVGTGSYKFFCNLLLKCLHFALVERPRKDG